MEEKRKDSNPPLIGKQSNTRPYPLVNGHFRMPWESYYYLVQLVERDKAWLEQEYHRATLYFIPTEDYDPKRPSGLDKAHKCYIEAIAKREKILKELHAACALTYRRSHKKMRQFWHLE